MGGDSFVSLISIDPAIFSSARRDFTMRLPTCSISFDGIAICIRTTHKACRGPNSLTAWGTLLIPTPPRAFEHYGFDRIAILLARLAVTLIEHPEARAEGQRPLP